MIKRKVGRWMPGLECPVWEAGEGSLASGRDLNEFFPVTHVLTFF